MVNQTTFVKELLGIRNLDINSFVHFEQVPDYEIRNMKKAVKLYMNNILAMKKTGILFDSDCDGVCAGHMSADYTRILGCRVSCFMNPDKTHGITQHVLDWIETEGIEFLIVVDAGSQEIDVARELSERIPVLILDHHMADESNFVAEPNLVVVSTYYEGSPNKYLSGAGVTYRFLREVNKLTNAFIIDRYKIWVGMSVLSDSCYILDKENMHYTKYMRDNYSDIHLFTLFTNYGSTRDMFSYNIIPVINACARMGETQLVIDLVMTHDKKKVEALKERALAVKVAQDDLIKEALISIKTVEGVSSTISRLTDQSYSRVKGLVAQKLLEKYGKASIVLSPMPQDGVYNGSFRGVDNFTSETLSSFGMTTKGHLKACGVFIPEEKFSEIGNACLNHYAELLPKNVPDMKIKFGDYFKSVHDLYKIAFINEFAGEGFRKLTLLFEDVPHTLNVLETDRVRRVKHMTFEIVDFNLDVSFSHDGTLLGYPTLFRDWFTLIRS